MRTPQPLHLAPLLLLLAACGSSTDPEVSGAVQYPLSSWSLLQEFGVWNPNWRGFHLAEDANAPGGDTVFAIADGVVRAVFFGSEVEGYRGLMLIEHQIGGEFVTSLYGHISTQLGAPVSAGDRVTAGERIAFIAYDYEDGGDWGPHLHFGIHRGPTDLEAIICNVWLYVGYTRDCANFTHEEQQQFWYDPGDFLQSLGAIEPGVIPEEE